VKNTLSPAPHEIIQPAPVARKKSVVAQPSVKPTTVRPPKPPRMPLPIPPLSALAEPAADRRRLPLLS
jgi:hypothetical protein